MDALLGNMKRGAGAGEHERLLRAQVEIIAANLPIAIWLNPSWALVVAIPFFGFFPLFGTVAIPRLFAAVFLHGLNSAIAALLFALYRRDPSDTPAWFRRLTLFQVQVGASWGALVWLFWVPGNALNHVLIMVPIVAVLWTYAAARTTHLALYLAGVLPIFVFPMIRFLTDGSGVASALAIIFAVTFGYTLVIALGARKLTDTMMRTRFANEDLTTELRSARDDAMRKRYEAEAANASKTTFLANMSHELRTPLNAILGFSDIIASEAFGPVGIARYRDYAHDINASGSHLLSLINDILDIAKIEAGNMSIEPALLDAAKAIDDALFVLAPRAQEKRQHLKVRIAEDARHVHADARAFKQILLNLVTNAVKFTQNGGEIVVHGRRPEEGGFELVVEDNGPGINPTLLGRIFLPFNQVDNRYNRQEGGTGLGLSLVQGLAALHGGKAWIETDLGSGVKAHVYFPVANVRAIPLASERLTA